MPIAYNEVIRELATSKIAGVGFPMWQIIFFVMVPMLLALLFILLLLFFVKKKSKESVILYFRGEDVVSLERPVIDNQLFRVSGQSYKLGKLKPLHFRDGMWGMKPFYMLKDDVPVGLYLDDADKKIKISSETFTDAIENQTLKNFLTMQTSKEGIFMGISIGVVIGIIVTVALYAFKVLKP